MAILIGGVLTWRSDTAYEHDRNIRDRVAVIEVGETEHTKYGRIGRPEFRLALEAILAAGADACLEPRMLDGFSLYFADRNDPNRLSTALDLPHYAFASMVYRALAQGKFGSLRAVVSGRAAARSIRLQRAAGALSPAQFLAMKMQRHMYKSHVQIRHDLDLARANRRGRQQARAAQFPRPDEWPTDHTQGPPPDRRP